MIVFLLAAVNFTHILDVMIIMPLGDQFMRVFDVSPGQFSIMVSAYMVSAGVVGFLASGYIDRYDRKKALLTMYAGFSLGTMSVALATGFWQVVIARALTGAFGGMMGAFVLSIASDLYAYENRGKAIGIITASFSVASIVGVPVGLLLADWASWRAPFWAVGGVAAVLWVVLFFVFPSMKDHLEDLKPRTNPITFFTNALKDRNQLYALGMGFMIVIGQFMVVPFIAPSMIRNVGFDATTIALVYAFGGGATLFTSPISGRLTDKLGALKMFRIMVPLSFIVTLLLTNLGRVPIWQALIVTTFLFITFNGRMIPAQTMATAAVSPSGRGGFMSLKTALQQVAAAFASVLAGLIITETEGGELLNYGWVGLVSVCLTGVSLFLAPKLKVAAGN